MSLRNQNWITFGGEPVTGRTPTQVRVHAPVPGQTMTPEQAGFVAHAYKLFCDAVNVSAFPDGYHVQNRKAPDGTTVRMESVNGVHRVFLQVPGGKEQAVLLGGIGICLTNPDGSFIEGLTQQVAVSGGGFTTEPQPLILQALDASGKKWKFKKVSKYLGGNNLWSNGKQWSSVFTSTASTMLPGVAVMGVLPTFLIPRYHLSWAPNYTDGGVARYGVDNTKTPQSQRFGRYVFYRNATMKLAPTLNDTYSPPFLAKGTGKVVQLYPFSTTLNTHVSSKTLFAGLEQSGNKPTSVRTNADGTIQTTLPNTVIWADPPQIKEDGSQFLMLCEDYADGFGGDTDRYLVATVNPASPAWSAPATESPDPAPYDMVVTIRPANEPAETSGLGSWVWTETAVKGSEVEADVYLWSFASEYSRTATWSKPQSSVLNSAYYTRLLADGTFGPDEYVFEEFIHEKGSGSSSGSQVYATSYGKVRSPIDEPPQNGGDVIVTTGVSGLPPPLGPQPHFTGAESLTYSYEKWIQLPYKKFYLRHDTRTDTGSQTTIQSIKPLVNWPYSGIAKTIDMALGVTATSTQNVLLFRDHKTGTLVYINVQIESIRSQTYNTYDLTTEDTYSQPTTGARSLATTVTSEIVIERAGTEYFRFDCPVSTVWLTAPPADFSSSTPRSYAYAERLYDTPGSGATEIGGVKFDMGTWSGVSENVDYSSSHRTATGVQPETTPSLDWMITTEVDVALCRNKFHFNFARDPVHPEVMVFFMTAKEGTNRVFSQTYAVGSLGVFELSDAEALPSLASLGLPAQTSLWADKLSSSLVSI